MFIHNDIKNILFHCLEGFSKSLQWSVDFFISLCKILRKQAASDGQTILNSFSQRNSKIILHRFGMV